MNTFFLHCCFALRVFFLRVLIIRVLSFRQKQAPILSGSPLASFQRYNLRIHFSHVLKFVTEVCFVAQRTKRLCMQMRTVALQLLEALNFIG